MNFTQYLLQNKYDDLYRYILIKNQYTYSVFNYL